MTNFNWVDFIFLIIFFLSVMAGFARGFVKEVVSLVTLIAAFVIASMFANSLANYLINLPFIQNMTNQAASSMGVNTTQAASYAALAISFGLLFAATILLGAIVGSFVNVAFTYGILGIGNRLLGGLFGFVRGVLVNLVIIFIVQLTPVSNQSWWGESTFVAAYQPAVQWLGDIVSPSLENLKTKLGQTLKNMGGSFQGVTNKFGNF